MKITQQLKNIANRIADNGRKQRELARQLNIELEKLGVNMDDSGLIETMAYLEGDCSSSELIDYLEEL